MCFLCFRILLSHCFKVLSVSVKRSALTVGSYPKSPNSDHNTVDKNSIEQNIEQCQHPGEGTHIHVVEEV